MKIFIRCTLAASALAFGALAAPAQALAAETSPPAAAGVATTRLYTLDCGRISTKDFGLFADTGEYDGKPGKVVGTCYVIRHPKGVLVWDTGLPDAIAEHKEGVDNNGIHLEMPATVASQLQAIGLTPGDVTYVAFSHFHFDHTGNANLFKDATWLLSKAELDWATAPGNGLTNPDSFSAYKTAKTQFITGDLDVFGDGTVKILKAPGHTPGHQALEVKLAKSGVVVLSGDLYHTLANRQFKRVPSFNTERADTLASMDRIEKIVKNTHARFVIQHAPEDFAKLPKLPAYLD